MLEGKTSSIILAGSGVLWVSCLIYQTTLFLLSSQSIERLRFLRYPTCDIVAGMMGRSCCEEENGEKSYWVSRRVCRLCTGIVSKDTSVCSMHMFLGKCLGSSLFLLHVLYIDDPH